MSFASLRDQTDRTFARLAQDKRLDLFVSIAPALPRSMYTDDKRLQQVKNLLSNAPKFTQVGSVSLPIARADDGWALGNDHLNKGGQVLAFSVEDIGIWPARRGRPRLPAPACCRASARPSTACLPGHL